MPKAAFFWISTCVFLMVFSLKSFSQTIPNFTGISTVNGLSSNTVNVIIEDSYGFIWFGTPNGLNKFDGTNVNVYRHIPGDPHSLPGNQVQALYQDDKGILWIGTSDGLCTYNAKLNSFIRYDAFKGSPVRSICSDSGGKMWIGSYNDLKILDPESNKVFKVPTPAEARRQENVFAVLSLFEDNKKRMWVGTQVGVYQYNPQTLRYRPFVHQSNSQNSLSNNYVTGITQDQSGNLWFATLGGLNLLNKNEKDFQVFKESKGNTAVKGGDILHVIVPAPNNQLWIGTEDGLRILNTETKKVSRIGPDKRNVFSLKNSSVRSIYISTQGVFWIGLLRGGVNKLNNKLALFNYQTSNPFDPSGLAAPVVTSFAEYKFNQFFVGTENGGLQLFNPNTRLFKSYNLRSKRFNESKDLSVLSLKLSRTGTLWVGTDHDGLFKLNPETKGYEQFLDPRNNNSISENVIFCIEEDRRGNIWIGTNGMGANMLDPKSNRITRFGRGIGGLGKEKSPLNGFIRAIAEAPDGNIWIGSYGSGVGIYNPLKGRFTHLRAVNSGLINDHVNTILHDKSGRTWIGSNGGLSRYDKNTKKFVNYTEKDGLPSGIVYKILDDKRGKLWISTDKGISSFEPKTTRFENFSKDNGLQESPFITGAGLAASNGHLFFGGESGFNYFDPATLPVDKHIPPVVLTELKVSNSVVNPGEGSPIDAQIGFANEVKLKHGQNFSLSYVALNYSNPRQNQYSYRMIGLDREWNYVGSATTAQYTNLDPGTYTFLVRTSNHKGIWSKTPKAIQVIVQPPWYRTTFAYLLYVIGICGLLLYSRKRGIQKIRTQVELEQEKLRTREQIEQERREAERLHELDLLKIKFLTNLSHEFRTPISLILAPVEKMLASANDSAISAQLTMVRRNAKRLLNLVNQLLDFRKMEEHELKLNPSAGDLIAFIRDAADSFRDLSERKKINFIFDTEIENLPALFDQDKVERIVFNLLSNAFKFTLTGGEITLQLYLLEGEEGKRLCMDVSDTGIGMPEAQQENVFDRFFQHNSGGAVLNQGSGIGLSIAKEFVRMHGGDISVKSEQGKGSTFTVILPVREVESTDLAAITVSTVGPEPDQEPSEKLRGMPNALPVVLIVEDNEDFRFYLKDNLKAYYQIVEASNGKEGWQKALSCHPELIVTDISMPFMTGIELSRKIKADKRTSHIPVVLLTALTGEEDQIKGLESGANDYLTKPFNFEILNAKIRNLLTLNRTLKSTYSKQIQMQGTEPEIEASDTKFLSQIMKYIEENLNDPKLSVEELSKHIGMSRASLYHKVLETTGLSPLEYIRTVKLDKAAALLEKSDYNVSQVAYMTGFGTPNYFARMFKARFKILPSEFVNLKRKDRIKRIEERNFL